MTSDRISLLVYHGFAIPFLTRYFTTSSPKTSAPFCPLFYRRQKLLEELLTTTDAETTRTPIPQATEAKKCISPTYQVFSKLDHGLGTIIMGGTWDACRDPLSTRELNSAVSCSQLEPRPANPIGLFDFPQLP